jgi:hypothetical protein
VNRQHRRALVVLGATVLLDGILGVSYGLTDHIGVAHGLYCSTGIATTVGCDVVPANGPSYVLSTLMMLTIVPLFSSMFSLFTSGLVASHVDTKTDRQTQDLKEHVSDAARNP